MVKYKEIVECLGLDEFFSRHFDTIYLRLDDLSSQVVPGDNVRMTDEAKKELVTIASTFTQTGGNLDQYKNTKKRVISEGITEERFPQLIVAATLAYMIDIAIDIFEQGIRLSESYPKLLYQSLDFLNKDEIRYLGLERSLA